MTTKEVKKVLEYYATLEEAILLLSREALELEADCYNGLGAANMDGMPRGGEPGKPVENMAILAAENRAAERIRAINEHILTLRGDQRAVKSVLDGIYIKYKKILYMRYLRRYTWGRISVRLEIPESTARDWHGRAVRSFGSEFSQQADVLGILERASRARTF